MYLGLIRGGLSEMAFSLKCQTSKSVPVIISSFEQEGDELDTGNTEQSYQSYTVEEVKTLIKLMKVTFPKKRIPIRRKKSLDEVNVPGHENMLKNDDLSCLLAKRRSSVYIFHKLINKSHMFDFP
uniref:Uncharacterized protein n=1 Tax=Megaselia scalaris TaxID=36166 RepID=T1GFG2_MEGSC